MFLERLSKHFYRCVHGGRYPVKEVSELTEIPESTIYRSAQGFMLNASGCPPNVRTFFDVMKAQNDYKPLKFACNYFGRLFIKLPRVGRNKKNTLEKIRHLQERYLICTQFLLEYDRTPTKLLLSGCIKSLYQSIEYETGILRDLRYNFHQLELPFTI